MALRLFGLFVLEVRLAVLAKLGHLQAVFWPLAFVGEIIDPFAL